MLDRLKANLQFAYPELKAFVTGNLPSFVYSSNGEVEDEVIIFSFHTPDPGLLDAQMRFLVENHYHVITTEQLHQYLLDGQRIPPRTVMLTFDDCRASLWSIVHPILKRYGLHGVSYVAPYFIADRGVPRRQWDVRDDPQPFIAKDHESYPFSSWEEVREMHASGVIDFQGHTYFHELIFVSDDVVDFLRPGRLWEFHTFGVPVVRESGQERYDRKLPLGIPIYRMDLRMSGRVRYFDDEQLRDQCAKHVQEGGGERYFEKRGWRRELRSIVSEYRRRNEDKGYFETPEETRAYLREDLLRARSTLERGIPGKRVTSMCFPWEVGSDLAIEIARDVGYRSCTWGILPGRSSNRVGDDPYRICRVSSDFIFRLPGKGRVSVAGLLAGKAMKRVSRIWPQG